MGHQPYPTGTRCKKEGDGLFRKPVGILQGEMVSNWKRFSLYTRTKFFDAKGGEAVAQVAQGGGGYPMETPRSGWMGL